MKTEKVSLTTIEIVLQYNHTKYTELVEVKTEEHIITTVKIVISGIYLAVGIEWETLMALSLHEPEVTLILFIFVSFVRDFFGRY